MDEVNIEDNNSKVFISRPDFLFEIKSIMKEHSISLEQALSIYFMLYEIEYEISAETVIVLFQKGLLKAGNKVSLIKLFKDKKKREQLEIGFNYSTKPNVTDETAKLVTNLETIFVPEYEKTEISIKTFADEWFKGDIEMTRHFIIFKYLFPKENKIGDNSLWNIHFKFAYEGVSRWSNSTAVARKFQQIYITKDIGLFLSGTYYFIRDSIDPYTGECFSTKPNKFLDAYKSWYEVAENKLVEKQKAKENSTATTISL